MHHAGQIILRNEMVEWVKKHSFLEDLELLNSENGKKKYIDDVFDEGISTRGIINMARYSGHNWFGLLFPFHAYTNWCVQNLGLKNVFKNLDIFLRLNVGGGVALVIDSVMLIKKIISK